MGCNTSTHTPVLTWKVTTIRSLIQKAQKHKIDVKDFLNSVPIYANFTWRECTNGEREAGSLPQFRQVYYPNTFELYINLINLRDIDLLEVTSEQDIFLSNLEFLS